MACVLVVEDEEQVRVLAQEIIEGSGHRTMSAGTFPEALALLEDDGARGGPRPSTACACRAVAYHVVDKKMVGQANCLKWVKTGRSRSEQMLSGLSPKALENLFLRMQLISEGGRPAGHFNWVRRSPDGFYFVDFLAPIGPKMTISRGSDGGLIPSFSEEDDRFLASQLAAARPAIMNGLKNYKYFTPRSPPKG
jgi:CheY-like chemotaxis protein